MQIEQRHDAVRAAARSEFVEVEDEAGPVRQRGQAVVIGGVVQLLDQADVAEAGRHVGREDLDQLAVAGRYGACVFR